MQPVLVLRHGPDVPAGYLGDALDAAGVPVATAALDSGAEVPDHVDWSGVVSLGGEMGAYDEGRYPFLAAEKSFLRKAADAGVPVLGICLGCQLLADALGGRAFRAPVIELGYFPVRLTAAGETDPVVSCLTGPTLVWHQDTWELPPGAELLAESDRYPQAFRLGEVVGIQPHPEASPDITRRWAATEGLDHFAHAGVAKDQLLASHESHRAEGEATAARLFGAWVESLG